MDTETMKRLWAKFTNDVAVTSEIAAEMVLTATKDAGQFLGKNLAMIMDMAKSFMGS